MRAGFLTGLLLISSFCFSQSAADSTAAAKNKLLIEQLRQRIAAIEDPHSIINDLKEKDRKSQDSIALLNKLLAEKRNAEIMLPACDCFRMFYGVKQISLNYAEFTQLDSIASLLKKDPLLKLKIVGHADKTGDEQRNIELSKERAATLKNYLVEQKKLDENRINTEWHGSSIPSKDSRQEFLNRRVEVFVTR